MEHDQLVHDLYAYKKRIGIPLLVAKELSLARRSGGGIIDVATVRPTWGSLDPTAFEVKANRKDFRSDIRRGKYRRYQTYVKYLYFATPAGMVSKDEVPEECGLIVRSKKSIGGWHGVKAPSTLHEPAKTYGTFLRSLLFHYYYKDRLDLEPESPPT